MRPFIQTPALSTRLRKRAAIRRVAAGRKSVEEGKADRLADQLDEAAKAIEQLYSALDDVRAYAHEVSSMGEQYTLGALMGFINEIEERANPVIEAFDRDEEV